MFSRLCLGVIFGVAMAGGGLVSEGRADHWNRHPSQCGPQRGHAGAGRPVVAGRPIVVVPHGYSPYGFRDFGVPAYGYRMSGATRLHYGGGMQDYRAYPGTGGWRMDGRGAGAAFGPGIGPSYGGGSFPSGPSYGGGGWGISIYGR